MLNEELRRYAEQELSAHPDDFTEEVKANIREQRIVVGMDPHEARLAGGAFSYKVKLDLSRWKKGTNPLKVIAHQATAPDDSEITLTFQNYTQFATGYPAMFRVEIRRGKVQSIERIF